MQQTSFPPAINYKTEPCPGIPASIQWGFDQRLRAYVARVVDDLGRPTGMEEVCPTKRDLAQQIGALTRQAYAAFS